MLDQPAADRGIGAHHVMILLTLLVLVGCGQREPVTPKPQAVAAATPPAPVSAASPPQPAAEDSLVSLPAGLTLSIFKAQNPGAVCGADGECAVDNPAPAICRTFLGCTSALYHFDGETSRSFLVQLRPSAWTELKARLSKAFGEPSEATLRSPELSLASMFYSWDSEPQGGGLEGKGVLTLTEMRGVNVHGEDYDTFSLSFGPDGELPCDLPQNRNRCQFNTQGRVPVRTSSDGDWYMIDIQDPYLSCHRLGNSEPGGGPGLHPTPTEWMAAMRVHGWRWSNFWQKDDRADAIAMGRVEIPFYRGRQSCIDAELSGLSRLDPQRAAEAATVIGQETR